MGTGQGQVFEYEMGQGWGVHLKPSVGMRRDISRWARDVEWAICGGSVEIYKEGGELF
jgi:hypothetical protein